MLAWRPFGDTELPRVKIHDDGEDRAYSVMRSVTVVDMAADATWVTVVITEYRAQVVHGDLSRIHYVGQEMPCPLWPEQGEGREGLPPIEDRDAGEEVVGVGDHPLLRQKITEIARHRLQIDGFASCIGQ